jgi:hypothetical protein
MTYSLENPSGTHAVIPNQLYSITLTLISPLQKGMLTAPQMTTHGLKVFI